MIKKLKNISWILVLVGIIYLDFMETRKYNQLCKNYNILQNSFMTNLRNQKQKDSLLFEYNHAIARHMSTQTDLMIKISSKK